MTVAKVPTIDSFSPESFYAKKKSLLLDTRHDWSKGLEEGPWDIGFNKSVITTGGIQNPPYVFLRNEMLDVSLNNITYWDKGNYSMSEGISRIKTDGEGQTDWDSSAYNMILVNETKAFLDDHVTNNPQDPFFAYVALGSVHIPHSPPYKYLDNSKIAGIYPNGHLDVLLEMDKVVGSLIKALDDRKQLEDTIVVFTSDNGGLGAKHSNSSMYGHLSNGPLRGKKGDVYEGGIRIPLVFRWDNGRIKKDETRSKLVGLNDLYATLCKLVDVEKPPKQAKDSISFDKYLINENRSKNLRETVAAWKYENNTMTIESIQNHELKLIRYVVSNTYELYNLTADLSESNDISAGNQDLIDDLLASLKKFGACYDKPGRFTVGFRGKKRIRKRCGWFGNKATRSRCLQYPDAQDHCRLTCAMTNSKYCDHH